MPNDNNDDDESVDLHVNRDSEDYKLAEQALAEGKRVDVSAMSPEEKRQYFRSRFERFVGHAGEGMTTEELMELTRGE